MMHQMCVPLHCAMTNFNFWIDFGFLQMTQNKLALLPVGNGSSSCPLITTLSLKKARSSIGADCGSGLRGPLVELTLPPPPLHGCHPLAIKVSPSRDVPPPPLTCHPRHATWPPDAVVHGGGGVSDVPWPGPNLLFNGLVWPMGPSHAPHPPSSQQMVWPFSRCKHFQCECGGSWLMTTPLLLFATPFCSFSFCGMLLPDLREAYFQRLLWNVNRTLHVSCLLTN